MSIRDQWDYFKNPDIWVPVIGAFGGILFFMSLLIAGMIMISSYILTLSWYFQVIGFCGLVGSIMFVVALIADPFRH